MGRRTTITTAILATMLLAGCGASERVTYVDPNPPSAYTESGTAQTEPFAQHGADAAHLAAAVRRVRGLLEVTAALAPRDPALARTCAALAREDAFAVLEPWLYPQQEALAQQLDSVLSRLADGTVAPLRVRPTVDALVRGPIARAEIAVLPSSARQDQRFRAAVLVSSLMDASTDLDGITSGEAPQDARAAFWRAAAATLDARTKGLQDVPHADRERLAATLDRILTSAFARLERDPRSGVGDNAARLASAADEITTVTRVDPVVPVPDPATPDHLRSLKSRVASALETLAGGDETAGLAELSGAVAQTLQAAAPGVASVDPALLVEIERLVRVELPNAVDDGADPKPVAVELDARIDEAIELVEDELEIQRETS